MDVAVNKLVEVHAGSVDYQTFGANDAPETIVPLHAPATDAWSLVPLAARLTETYRVFVPNFDGYGVSSTVHDARPRSVTSKQSSGS